MEGAVERYHRPMILGVLLAVLIVAIWASVIWTRGYQSVRIAQFEQTEALRNSDPPYLIPIRIHKPFSVKRSSTFAVLDIRPTTQATLVWRYERLRVLQFSFEDPVVALGNIGVWIVLESGKEIYGSTPEKYAG
jgi:hypothetical protein